MVICQKRPHWTVTLELDTEEMNDLIALCRYPSMNSDDTEQFYGAEASKRMWKFADKLLSALPKEE